MLNEELRQDDLIRPQRVVPILPVKHQVVLIIRICGERGGGVFSVMELRGKMRTEKTDGCLLDLLAVVGVNLAFYFFILLLHVSLTDVEEVLRSST